LSLLRTIRPLERASAQSRVGWTSQPLMMVVLTSLIRGGAGPLPDRRRHALGESGLLCLLHITLSSSTTPGRGSPANRTRPWPRRRLSEVICRRPKAKVCDRHKLSGFLTACDHAEQRPGLACSRASGPTSRERNTTPSHSVQHIARTRGHKRLSEKAREA
jgi:hypothetical protein